MNKLGKLPTAVKGVISYFLKNVPYVPLGCCLVDGYVGKHNGVGKEGRT